LDGVLLLLLLLLKSKETMLVLLAFGISWMVIGAWLGVYLAWQTVGFHFFGLHHAVPIPKNHTRDLSNLLG